MKKVASYILIVLGLGILFVSTSRKMMGKISSARNDWEGSFGTHQSNQGDLVDMAFLDYVPQFHSQLDYSFPKPACNCAENINLYALGDSYIHMAPDSTFACVNQYKYAWRYLWQLPYTIDSTKKNILIIEVAERYIRSFLSTQDAQWMVQQETLVSLHHSPSSHQYAAFPIPDSVGDFFNPLINQNIEYNMFNYNFLNPIRETKAWFNYHVFDRASGNVTLSDNGKQLFLKETTVPKAIESSYSTISNKEIDLIVANLNDLYQHYTTNGFDQVYISLIPNPATILQPDGYNQLIPLIQNHKDLKMPVIDIYSVYKHADQAIYRKGDTHWNGYGHKLWIDAVNKVLIEESAQ